MHSSGSRARVLVPHNISPLRPLATASLALLQGRSMGCDWSVRAALDPATEASAVRASVQNTLDTIVNQMSTWEFESDISRFNRAVAGTWCPVPPEFADALGCALRVADASGGACDLTAGELVQLWGFGPTHRYNQPGFALPDADLIEYARQRCGWQRLEVDLRQMCIYQPGGISLDLSAIAKGYGVDAVSNDLQALGVSHHLVDLGGELRGCGVKPDGQPWWVEIEPPPGAAALPVTRIALHGMAIATSGDYLQCYERGAARYSHCIDPRVGRPVDNDVCSVTVVHRDCAAADAWSTALMVLGAAQGTALANEQQLAARFIVREPASYQEYWTRAFDELIVA